ncbi:MAG: hypothetical protein NTU44_16955 [Bacteroidetes bacterium]|nr:hypothetical protein [Bacteroidota bacterium]
MNIIRAFLFPFLLLSSITFVCFSQNLKPIPYDSTLIFWSLQNNNTLDPVNNLPYDTLLPDVEHYDPATSHYQAFASQGNIGRPVNNLIFNPFHPAGFDAGVNSLDVYRFNPDKLKYYRQFFPFSDVHYMMGAKKEQLLDLTHSQNIGKFFTAGACLRIINSPGGYYRQKSDISNLAFTLQFKPKNDRYQASAAFCQNIIKLQENGGLVLDSYFENNTEPDRKVIPVNLANAQTRIRETSVTGWQQIKLLPDSLLKERALFNFLPVVLTHSLNYSEISYVYEEPNPYNSFYPFYPLDSTDTQDLMLIHRFTNNFSLNTPEPDSFIFSYSLGLRHEYIWLRNGDLTAEYYQISPNAGLIMKLPLAIETMLTVEKCLSGYKKEDQEVELRISKKFGKKPISSPFIEWWLKRGDYSPAWTQQHYRSNLLNWDNRFISEKIQSQGLIVHLWGFQAGLTQTRLQHHIINLPNTSAPWQITDNIQVSQAFLQKSFRMWKIVFDNRVDYQKVNKEELLRLPEWITRHSLYFDFNIFKGALLIQPGIDLYYQSSYYADAYMPVTRSFYLQNDTKIKEQVYADIFIRMTVSRARIFLKYQHFNSKLGAYDYYLIPHYPMQDAALKFGIYWLLRDFPDRDKKVSSKL